MPPMRSGSHARVISRVKILAVRNVLGRPATGAGITFPSQFRDGQMKGWKMSRHKLLGIDLATPGTDKSVKWWTDGFGLRVIDGIAKRVPKWESGVYHRGGIHSGTWILAWGVDPKRAAQIEAIFEMYGSATEFIDDN